MNISLRNQSNNFESCKSLLKPKFNVVGKNSEHIIDNRKDAGQAIKNDLLAALPVEDLDYLMPHLKFEYVPVGKCLFNYGEKITQVYFPTTAVIGLLYFLVDGRTSEIAVVGYDGLLGISCMIDEKALGTAIVQSAGCVYALKVPILQEVCENSARAQRIIMRYLHRLFGQVAQNSACSRYSIDRQLSRWLLGRLDRLPGDELKITQGVIASLLGVRRESITAAAHRLQDEGMIQYRRGLITVLNRSALEKFAGDCYTGDRQR